MIQAATTATVLATYQPPETLFELPESAASLEAEEYNAILSGEPHSIFSLF